MDAILRLPNTLISIRANEHRGYADPLAPFGSLVSKTLPFRTAIRSYLLVLARNSARYCLQQNNQLCSFLKCRTSPFVVSLDEKGKSKESSCSIAVLVVLLDSYW
jgi:hypothetical protein